MENSFVYGNIINIALLVIFLIFLSTVFVLLWKKKKKNMKKFHESIIFKSPDGSVEILLRYKKTGDKYGYEYNYKPEEIEISGEDITSCLKLVDKKYRLSSITIADSEGLVVGSTSNAPEEDAAYAVSFSLGAGVGEKIDRIELIGKQNSYIFNVTHPEVDTNLIVIAKAMEKIPEKYLIKLEKDVVKTLEKVFSASKKSEK